MSRFVVNNGQETPMTVWLEPWAEDYTLLRGQECTFVADEPGEDFYFHLELKPRDLLLYAAGTCRDVRVLAGGREVTCGYQREHRRDRAP